MATLARKTQLAASATSSPLMPSSPSSQVPPAQVARFSVERYHALLASGLLTENDRFELLNGWIVQKMTINPAHAFCVSALDALLAPRLGPDWVLRCQQPITTTDSEPEPDLAIVVGPRRQYIARHPGLGEVELVIEVADTSLELDLTTKLRIYALAKIPQYWVVNLNARCVEVFTMPRGGKSPRYRQQVTVGADGDITLSLRGQPLATVPVREFLP